MPLNILRTFSIGFRSDKFEGHSSIIIKLYSILELASRSVILHVLS